MADTDLERTITSAERRYDELAALVHSVADRPEADSSALAQAGPFICAESRRLDLGHYDAWLESLTSDVVLWVPLSRDSHPATNQALFLDDGRRLHERVSWRRNPRAWGQQPGSICVRTVGTVEAWAEGNTIVANSAITLTESRAGVTQHIAGHQIHELVDGGTRCRSKILLLPGLACGLRNPSFIL